MPDGEHRVQPLHKIHSRIDHVSALAFSPNDSYLAAGCNDGTFHVFNAKQQFKSVDLHNSSEHSDGVRLVR
jgi:WD40 repeat protein